jgi:hypothetical protein
LAVAVDPFSIHQIPAQVATAATVLAQQEFFLQVAQAQLVLVLMVLAVVAQEWEIH